MSTITERVAAGAAFLDEHDPEWWREGVDRAIDLDALDMAAGDVCILGQRCPLNVYAESEWGVRFYAYGEILSGIDTPPEDDGEEDIDHWAAHLGFQVTFGALNSGPQYDDLAAEWKRVITERRSA